MCSITFAILFGWHSHQSSDCWSRHHKGYENLPWKFHYDSLWSLEQGSWKLIKSPPCFYESESEFTQSWTTLCDPWTVVGQAPPSMGFSRQEHWTGLPFPSPGDLPDPCFYGDTKSWWSLPQKMLLPSQAMIPCPLSCCWYVGSSHH